MLPLIIFPDMERGWRNVGAPREHSENAPPNEGSGVVASQTCSWPHAFEPCREIAIQGDKAMSSHAKPSAEAVFSCRRRWLGDVLGGPEHSRTGEAVSIRNCERTKNRQLQEGAERLSLRNCAGTKRSSRSRKAASSFPFEIGSRQGDRAFSRPEDRHSTR